MEEDELIDEDYPENKGEEIGDIYEDSFQEEAINDDEISPEEEGFMKGYNKEAEIEEE
jgi:hypothetical protein